MVLLDELDRIATILSIVASIFVIFGISIVSIVGYMKRRKQARTAQAAGYPSANHPLTSPVQSPTSTPPLAKANTALSLLGVILLPLHMVLVPLGIIAVTVEEPFTAVLNLSNPYHYYLLYGLPVWIISFMLRTRPKGTPKKVGLGIYMTITGLCSALIAWPFGIAALFIACLISIPLHLLAFRYLAFRE